MTPAERKASTDRILSACIGVMSTKEIDYASKEDTMANFKRNAERSSATNALTELAWAAGFFDGEGCVKIQRSTKQKYQNYQPVISIGQVDRRPLDRFARAVGMPDRVSGPYTQKTHLKASPSFRFRTAGSNVTYAILEKLWPWLSQPKKEQAIRIFRTVRENQNPRKSGGRRPTILDPAQIGTEHAYKVTKYQVWQTYANKHWDAINNAISYHPENPRTETESEPLYGRIVDAINYLTILANLLDEDLTDTNRACDQYLERTADAETKAYHDNEDLN